MQLMSNTCLRIKPRLKCSWQKLGFKGGVFQWLVKQEHSACRFSTQFFHILCIVQFKPPIIWMHHLPFARYQCGLSLTRSNILYTCREEKGLHRNILIRYCHIKNQCCIGTFPFILPVKCPALPNRNSRFQCVNGNIYLVINVRLCFSNLVVIIPNEVVQNILCYQTKLGM